MEIENDWAKEELSVLMSDMSARQREINIRSRWENYNFVLVVLSIASIAALYPALYEQITVSLPVLTSVAAFTLSLLPINLAHIASSTELRRHYIAVRIAPRIRSIIALKRGADIDSKEPLLTFEKFDRAEHRPLYNSLLTVRGVFSLLPSLGLGVLSVLSIATDKGDVVVNWVSAITGLVAVSVAITLSVITLVSMNRRTNFVFDNLGEDVGGVWIAPRAGLKMQRLAKPRWWSRFRARGSGESL